MRPTSHFTAAQPPGVSAGNALHAQQTAYATNIARSLTIDEMRDLHRRAEREAEAKRTELRLVLASRYRELVGSSDEVLHMQKRAEELDGLVRALPGLVEKLVRCAEAAEPVEDDAASRRDDESPEAEASESAKAEREEREEQEWRLRRQRADRVAYLRRCLSSLPRSVHRSLDARDVHGAALGLVSLFGIVSALTSAFPLSNALSTSMSSSSSSSSSSLSPSACVSTAAKPGAESDLAAGDALLRAQVKMTYLHVQTLPARAARMARNLLLRPASSSSFSSSSPASGSEGGRCTAEGAARALSALELLDVKRSITPAKDRANKLVDVYFDSKATLVRKLLGRLREGGDAASDDAADEILSLIVAILQYDIILHPYQIFILRRFLPSEEGSSASAASPLEFEAEVMSSLPPFDRDVVKSKASNFLASFLPLIRNKVKSVLMSIAGTTAARLGNIRQSLYDKTDGADRMRALEENGLCRWEEAVGAIVDGHVVGAHGTTAFVAVESTYSTSGTGRGSAPPSGTVSVRRFSLWSALFSSTFSNLVHSILSTSFHSVHASVVSSLRSSLAAAPPLRYILPHEAHRNALRIATDLDRALRKVSDDAHELLVHAEEREESERRLRQSLYVQTCEIMGRLLNELRRMLPSPGRTGHDAKDDEATTELIVGRLCHLLKFRLTSLPTLLDPANSPAAMAAAGGRDKLSLITLEDLRSAFDLADDDDDGLISLEEAMEAAESAFSGTSFRGAEMVRDTLLLSSKSVAKEDGDGESYRWSGALRDVTLPELVLLSSRGLKHTPFGPESALGTVQASLDLAVRRCFAGWARAALRLTLRQFREGMEAEVDRAVGCSESEWRRLHGFGTAEHGDASERYGSDKLVGGVASHVTACLLSMSATFHQSVCPSDSLPPAPSLECAAALGVIISDENKKEGIDGLPNMMRTIRGALLSEAAISVASSMREAILADERLNDDALLSDDSVVLKANKLSKCGESALIQLLLDVSFLDRCFFERNINGFGGFECGIRNTSASEVDFVDEGDKASNKGKGVIEARETLVKIMSDIQSALGNSDGSLPEKLETHLKNRQNIQISSFDLFVAPLFGEDRPCSSALAVTSYTGASLSFGGNTTGGAESVAAAPLLNPLQSTRRFALLPIQAERSLQELQMRGKFGKEKQERTQGTPTEGYGGAVTGAVSSGFGFFSSMLKKK